MCWNLYNSNPDLGLTQDIHCGPNITSRWMGWYFIWSAYANIPQISSGSSTVLSCSLGWTSRRWAFPKWLGLIWDSTVMSHEHHGIWDHWALEWLFKSLFMVTSKKHQRSKLLTLCKGKSLIAGKFPSWAANNVEKDLRHHVTNAWCVLYPDLLQFGTGWFYPYPSGLLHWHWGNHMIAPLSAKESWRIWVNTSLAYSTIKYHCNHSKENKTLHIS